MSGSTPAAAPRWRSSPGSRSPRSSTRSSGTAANTGSSPRSRPARRRRRSRRAGRGRRRHPRVGPRRFLPGPAPGPAACRASPTPCRDGPRRTTMRLTVARGGRGPWSTGAQWGSGRSARTSYGAERRSNSLYLTGETDARPRRRHVARPVPRWRSTAPGSASSRRCVDRPNWAERPRQRCARPSPKTGHRARPPRPATLARLRAAPMRGR